MLHLPCEEAYELLRKEQLRPHCRRLHQLCRISNYICCLTSNCTMAGPSSLQASLGGRNSPGLLAFGLAQVLAIVVKLSLRYHSVRRSRFADSGDSSCF